MPAISDIFLTVNSTENRYLKKPLELTSYADFLTLQEAVEQLGGDFSGYYSKNEVDGLLNLKANAADVFTKTESDAKYATILALTNYFTKNEIITNYYDKPEIDNKLVAIESKLSSVYVLKGTVANLAALNAIVNPDNGDVYNVADSGMNYVWVEAENAWDALGSIVDLSGYYIKSEVDSLLNLKADKLTTYTKTESDTIFATKAELGDYYTKTVADSTFVKEITVNGTSVGITKNNTTGIVNIDLSSYLSGVNNGISDLDSRVDVLEQDVDELQGKVNDLEIGATTGATYNGGAVTKTGTILVFQTVEINTTSTTMTKAWLNTNHSTKTIGFMLYCTNAALMTKYVKVSATEWSVEPIFLAQ